MNNEDIFVSIIIPVYNNERTIQETINSALNQTYSNTEILIIDDGSTDNSFDIVKKNENEKIKIFRQENRGVSASRNFGISCARGCYLQFLDADDLLHHQKIELQVEFIKKTNTSPSFVCSSWARIDEKSTLENLNIQNRYIPVVSNKITTYIKGDNFIPLMCGLIQREAALKISGFNEEMTHIEDVNFLLRLFITDNHFVLMPSYEPFFYYRLVKNSASQQNKAAFLKGIFTNYELVKSQIKHPYKDTLLFDNIWTVYSNAVSNNYYNLVSKVATELFLFKWNKKLSFKFLMFKLLGNDLYCRLVRTYSRYKNYLQASKIGQ